jgi:uncharacterized membrane protein YphA (DoxX/SURF4 family)
VREKLLSPWLTIRVQFVLAAVFVVAGFAKIADPPAFAQEIHNHRLLPALGVNPFALVLPWLEVVTGVALFFGLARRTAAGVFGILLIVFIGALGINLARGRAVECGCFGASAAAKTEAQLLTDMKLVILRDVGLLVLVGQVLAATGRRAPGSRLHISR